MPNATHPETRGDLADDHARIDPNVCRALGKSQDELLDMGLRDFVRLSYDKGILWEVTVEDPGEPGLTVTFEREQKAATA